MALRKMKKMPLRDVQSKYFDILDSSSGNLFSQMRQHGVSPQTMADQVASKDELVSAFRSDLPDFASGIREFRKIFGPVVETHLRDLGCMKSVFGGDVFPSYLTNIACSVGLYMDTIVLPDPLLSLRGDAEPCPGSVVGIGCNGPERPPLRTSGTDTGRCAPPR